LWTIGYGESGPDKHGFFFTIMDSTVFAANLNDPADLNTWVHLAGTYDGQNINLYVNGNRVASKALASSSFINGNSLFIAGTPICIGFPSNTSLRECNDFPSSWLSKEGFPGKIDEVSIWSRVLTAEEINTIYKAQSTSNWTLK
jgi:hypothetical protein